MFSGYGLYKNVKEVFESEALRGGQKPPLALMVEWGTEAYVPDVNLISLPVQSLSIANILNGKRDGNSYFENAGPENVSRFTFHGARLLVVDDILTNLKVAEGLLAPYKAVVETCQSGMQAIELVKQRDYDLIFMDHMMPVMDGIEATVAIRVWEIEFQKHTPIIALTANAVVGVRELFLEKGFDDFLAKPIDISKLNEILERWIPMEKRERGRPSGKNIEPHVPASFSLIIPGVDVKKGIVMTGGTEANYTHVLSMFLKDAVDRMPLLQTTPDPDTLSLFVTNVHALKSASASIGAAKISSELASLEAAGRAGDIDFIRKNLSGLAERLVELAKNIGAAMEKRSASVPTGKLTPRSEYMPLLRELALSLKSQKAGDIDRILEELEQKNMDSETKKAVERISDEVLVTEYDNALKIIEELQLQLGLI